MADEQVFSEERRNNNRLKVLRQEQKSVGAMQDLVDRVLNPGDVVFKHFAGSYKTKSSCILLPMYRFCIAPDHETYCRKPWLQQQDEMFTKPVLNDSSDLITGIDELKSVENTFA